MTTEPIASFAALRNRLRIGGTLVALTALRIGAGRSSDVSGTDLPVLRDALKRPFIPGASLKGALRARMEALVGAVQPEHAPDPLNAQGRVQQMAAFRDPQKPEGKEVADLLRRREFAEADLLYSRKVWGDSTLIDLTFGAQWTASRVFVKDALVDPQLWFGQFEVRNGVGIERDTETASDGKLYDYEVVPAGTRFAFELVMENAAPWQLGMLLLALQPWERGEAQIGGFRSRGLGYVRLEEASCHFTQLTDVDALLDLLDGKDRGEVTDEQRQAWRDAFRAVLIDPDEARKKVCEC